MLVRCYLFSFLICCSGLSIFLAVVLLLLALATLNIHLLLEILRCDEPGSALAFIHMCTMVTVVSRGNWNLWYFWSYFVIQSLINLICLMYIPCQYIPCLFSHLICSDFQIYHFISSATYQHFQPWNWHILRGAGVCACHAHSGLLKTGSWGLLSFMDFINYFLAWRRSVEPKNPALQLPDLYPVVPCQNVMAATLDFCRSDFCSFCRYAGEERCVKSCKEIDWVN